MHARYFACADFKGRDGHTFHTQMLVTRVGAPMSLRFWREHEDSERVGTSAWSLFASDTKYFAPSQAPFIINWRVRNLDGMLAQLRAPECASRRKSPRMPTASSPGWSIRGQQDRAVGAEGGILRVL